MRPHAKAKRHQLHLRSCVQAGHLEAPPHLPTSTTHLSLVQSESFVGEKKGGRSAWISELNTRSKRFGILFNWPSTTRNVCNTQEEVHAWKG